MVVMVIALIASIATVMVSRSSADSRVIVGSEDRVVARQVADRGLAVALAGIVAGEPDGFGTAERVGSGRFEVRARRVAEDRWQVESVGSRSDLVVVVTAAVARDEGGVWRVQSWEERVIGR
jgi:hypothetical protein